ncbi:MAG: hypothetical protein OHK93_003491 [Ramalina farinacea]|uniref:Uncharacterized protein n=1 Tax=Ramalina farinacea TaxID=258253 RepID=A0AA43QV54_9LECA|nr:hypothetical protein [Ramalina farinacea]
MAYINITGVSIHGQAWSNASGYYQGSSAYGLQEALSIGGSSAFDGLEDVAEISGFHTIHNCLLVPNLAFANLTPANEAFLEGRYALGPSLNTTAKNVVYQVNGKLFLITLSGCHIPKNFTSNFTTDWPDVYYNFKNSSDLLDEICQNVPSVVNADLGGIG